MLKKDLNKEEVKTYDTIMLGSWGVNYYKRLRSLRDTKKHLKTPNAIWVIFSKSGLIWAIHNKLRAQVIKEVIAKFPIPREVQYKMIVANSDQPRWIMEKLDPDLFENESDFLRVAKRRPFFILNFAIEKNNLGLIKKMVDYRPNYLYNYLGIVNKKDRPDGLVSDLYRMVLLNKRYYRTATYNRVSADGAPQEIFTPEFNIKFVSMAAKNVKYIPTSNLNYELCMQAVKKAGSSLAYVPNKFKDESLCKAALEHSFSALKFVPHKLQTSSVILKAMLTDRKAKKYIKKVGARG